MNTSKAVVGAVALFAAFGAQAGQVGNLTAFTPHTPAKAGDVNGNFNALKAAVNDNDARINANSADISQHTTRIEAVEAGGVPGTLITQRKGNLTFVERSAGGYIGFFSIIANYTPPADATAFIQTRCAFDGNGNADSKTLEHRVAIRTPTNSGAAADVAEGSQFYQRSTVPAADVSVQNVNSDYFDLAAGASYDFGVNFKTATPYGGVNPDYCSLVVMIYRR